MELPSIRVSLARTSMITAHQIRAARALLGMTMKELSEISGVSEPTIQRLEKQRGELQGLHSTFRKIEAALEARGVVFLEGGVIIKGKDDSA